MLDQLKYEFDSNYKNQQLTKMSRDIGQYKIFNVIGKGSFGKVYKGVDKLTGEEVALKFIEKKEKRERQLKNLRQENEILKKISHANVIQLKDVIETQREIIIVTDYAGRDLAGLMEEVKRLPLDKVKEFSIQILNAMVYLNQNKIVHRDLKTQNILLRNNQIKICDFGFAKKLSASTTFLQSMKGTPLYIAPEILRQTKYTDKVDIWSFGCIIYELFTGKTPFYANTYPKLAPLILYQQVQYPKEMPAELKELLSWMLQKNPNARPGWKELKSHSFFQQVEPLKEKVENGLIREGLKQVVSIEVPERPLVMGEDLYMKEDKEMMQNKENPVTVLQSKVIQKLDNEEEIKSYQDQFRKIQQDLTTNVIDGMELRRDVIFLHKIKSVLHERSQENKLISDQLLESIFAILNILIKSKKMLLVNAQKENAEEDDITKNETLIIGLLCIAKKEKKYDMLEKELKIICLLIKRNFNGVAINAEIDEEITEFVTEILLENYEKMPLECIRNGLIIIGTLVNQAIMTIGNSQQYFQRVAEDNLLGKIAAIFKKQEKHATVLQCIKQFIHPVRELPALTGPLPSRLLGVFGTLKEQVAEALLGTEFISPVSPFTVYSEKGPHIVDYCEVLLECLTVSQQFRAEFLKYSYWPEMFGNKKIRSLLFAYNQVFLKLEDRSIISKEMMAAFTKQSQQNKLVNVFIVEMGYQSLKQKSEKVAQKQNPQATAFYQAYEKSILQKISEYLFIDEQIKVKAVREIYGSLSMPCKRFDQPIVLMLGEIIESLRESSEENKELGVSIFKKVCNLANPFRPSFKALLQLMNLFNDNQLLKPLRGEKALQAFFYDCISDFIKKEQFEYLQIEFQEGFQRKFLAKMVKCMNCLIETEEKTSNVSQSALGLMKEVQTSCFYRFMFVDGLPEDEFYEHIKYIQRIITKTSQVSPQMINFLGVKVIPMCKVYLKTKLEPLLIEIFIFIAQIARDHPQFNHEILNTGIVKRIRQWLNSPEYSESLKEKLLFLVGNLAKKSEFFFGEFEAFGVMEGIMACLQRYKESVRVVKNVIYSVGNISFYSQKFYRDIEPMIPYFAKAFDQNQGNLRNNLVSTVSNLLRYSNIYLGLLIKTGLLGSILRVACEGTGTDQTLSNLIMSLIKKVLPYDEFYKEFGYGQLKLIYQRRQVYGGDSNETIKKIREVLSKVGEL